MPFASTFIWPAITKEIINQVNQWSLCQKYQEKKQKKANTTSRTVVKVPHIEERFPNSDQTQLQ